MLLALANHASFENAIWVQETKTSRKANHSQYTVDEAVRAFTNVNAIKSQDKTEDAQIYSSSKHISS